MELSQTQNDHLAIRATPIVVDVDGIALTIANAEPAGETYLITVKEALAIAAAWAGAAPAGALREYGHAEDLKAILLAQADADGLALDYWPADEFADQFAIARAPIDLTVSQLPVVDDPIVVDALAGYAVPLDPMEDLQCDSCQ